MDEKGIYIYVMDQSDGAATKIGIARDLKLRLKGVQSGNPQELRVHFSILVTDRKQAEAIERRAHQLLHEFRMFGEWFSCDAKASKAAIVRAAAGVEAKKGPAKGFYRGRRHEEEVPT